MVYQTSPDIYPIWVLEPTYEIDKVKIISLLPSEETEALKYYVIYPMS